MRYPGALLPMCLAVFLLVAPGRAEEPQQAPAVVPRVEGALQAEVDVAVERGVKALRDEQRRDGSFGTMPGETALALMALRHAGVPGADRACRRAASNLEHELPDGTVYGASLGVVALITQDAELHANKIEELLGDLVTAQCKNGQWTYAYRSTADKQAGDNSNTQFAILALGVARSRGLEVPAAAFARCRKFLLATQNEDGGYGYSDKERSNSYASMTAGGAMMLALTFAAEKDVFVTHPSVGESPELKRALAWLGKDFDPARNSGAAAAFGKGKKKIGDSFWKHYWLWSVERAGAASGAARFGTHDWYAEGARHLLDTQRKDGAWQNPEPRLRAICFALLFFGRGTKQALTPKTPDGPVTPSDD